jgi:prolyl-tRNA synthetase
VSIEAMMADGWALQSGTSHHLGQNFTRAYDIAYSDRENQRQHPFQTSWGLSTRTVGAVVMGHGDDMGLILPPKVAPVQVVVVPITRSNDTAGAAVVEEAVTRLERECPHDVRLRVDRREAMRPGEKYAHWELRGVPLRIVAGAKDLADGNVTLVHRVDGTQETMPIAGLAGRLPELLVAAQRAIFERARRRLEERSVDVGTLEELKAAFPGGGAPCRGCGEPAEFSALLARSY